MKKVSLYILLGGMVYLSGLDAQSALIKIKNESSESIYISLVTGQNKTVGESLTIVSIDPDTEIQQNATESPIYIGIWEHFVREADLQKTTGKGLKVYPRPTKLYKLDKPVNVVWKQRKLKPLNRYNKGKIEEITTIPNS